MTREAVDNLTIFGDHEGKTRAQMRAVTAHERALAGALMADGHLGFGMPIGGVVAYDNAVSPEGVGVDIACGNKAARTNILFEDLENNLVFVMNQIQNDIGYGFAGANKEWADHEVFDRNEWSLGIAASLKDKAREQLGSIGGGNHYVDLLVDKSPEQRVWIGVHFGSRGLGHSMAEHFIEIADGGKSGGGDRYMKEVSVIGLETSLGSDYWAAMTLGGAYAYAGRDCVVEKVRRILGANIDFEVHNNHNYAWKEDHPGVGSVVVVRKGATPAFPHQAGFVGGSMGDDAVILEGSAWPLTPIPDKSFQNTEKLQRAALYSTVHGAGRTMSRGAAKKAITHDEMQKWLDRRMVVLRGGDLDESPQAYRRLPDVLEAQGRTVEVTETLRPVGVMMASGRRKRKKK